MSTFLYTSFSQKLMQGLIDLDNDTLKVALVSSSYVPNQTAHVAYSDITNEVSGSGYTTGGVEISGKTVSSTGAFDANNATWSNSTITARGAVLYKVGTTDETSWLIKYIDFTEDKTSSSGTFSITWDSSGILSIS